MSAITGTSMFWSKAKKIKFLEDSRDISITRTARHIVVKLKAGGESAAEHVAEEYLQLKNVGFKLYQYVIEPLTGGYMAVKLLPDEAIAGVKRSTKSKSSNSMATTKKAAGTRTKKTGAAKKKTGAAAKKKAPAKFPYKKVKLRSELEAKGFGIPKKISTAAARVRQTGDAYAAGVLRREGLKAKKARMAKGALAGLSSHSDLKGKIIKLSNNLYANGVKVVEISGSKSKGYEIEYKNRIFDGPHSWDAAGGRWESDIYIQPITAAKLASLLEKGYVKYTDKNKDNIEITLSKRSGTLSGTASRTRRKKVGAAKRDPDFKLSAAQKRNLSPEMQKGLLRYHRGK